MKGYEYQSDFAKKYVAQGRDEGRTLGRDEGLSLGRAEGEARGRAEGEARALLIALQARGFAVPDAVRDRILAQKDQDCLERWLKKAIVASSLAEVLDDPS